MLFGKKTSVEILYVYSLQQGEIQLFTLSKLLKENLFYAIMPDSLMFEDLDSIEKVLSHLSQNFYYFVKNNFEMNKLKEEYEKAQKEVKIIGYSSFYYLAETDKGILVEFPSELVCENVYEMYIWLKEFVDNIKKDIKKYKESKELSEKSESSQEEIIEKLGAEVKTI